MKPYRGKRHIPDIAPCPAQARVSELQALGGAVGPPFCVTGQALPAANRGQPPGNLFLPSPALIMAHSVSGEHFVQQHGGAPGKS